jgi:hypothetical protein
MFLGFDHENLSITIYDVFCGVGPDFGSQSFFDKEAHNLTATIDYTFFDRLRLHWATTFLHASDWHYNEDGSRARRAFSSYFEVGYTQLNHRAMDTATLYLHGMRVGATVDFILPRHFSIQTGALLTLSYGLQNQHWPSMTEESAQVNILKHNIVQLQLTIPARAYYTIKVWKKLNFFVYGGPQLQFGLTSYDIINKDQISSLTLDWVTQQGILTESHDRYVAKEYWRTSIQMGLGGGLEWDRFRLQAGYDFGLNNIYRTPTLDTQKTNEWTWMTTFSYKF